MDDIITSAEEAQRMLGDETKWRWEDSLCPGDSVVAAVYDDESEDNIALICGPLPSHKVAVRRATLIVSAPALARGVIDLDERLRVAEAAVASIAKERDEARAVIAGRQAAPTFAEDEAARVAGWGFRRSRGLWFCDDASGRPRAWPVVAETPDAR